MATIKIGTLNARGGNGRKDHITRYFEEKNLDILMLQETHDIKTEYIKKMEATTRTKIYKNAGCCNSRGVLTMIRESDSIKNSKIAAQDNDGNRLEIEMMINGNTVTVINLYCPNKVPDRKRFIERLYESVDGRTNVIVGGDWNQPLNFKLDCTGKSERAFEDTKSVRDIIEKIKTDNEYCDAYRNLKPEKKGFTFSGPAGGHVDYRARLDYILVHKTLMEDVSNAGIDACPFSDHDMAWVEVSGGSRRQKWGGGCWKYNKKILEDKRNLRELEILWKTHRNDRHNYSNQLAWWDAGKAEIKQKCLQMGREMKAKENELELQLKQELEQEVRKEEDSSPRQIQILKNKLNEIWNNKIKGAQIRSRDEWENMGEKPSRYFFSLEREKGGLQQMHSLLNEEGTCLTEKGDIMDYVKNYYERHFQAATIDKTKQDILINSINKRLSENQSEAMDPLFTKPELRKVVSKAKLNKAPGMDGLTNEFYRQTAHFIEDDLLETINEVFLSGKMPRSMTQGMIKLIYKNKGEKTNLKNWRAISLLNSDYKFMTTLISARFQPVMAKLVATDQACSIPGRFIEDQLIQLQDLQDYVSQYGGKAMICGLDLQSAYDLLDHEYMQRVLHKMNFGPRITQLINTIHSNMFSCVSINGARTRMFRLTRSCRQGDPSASQQFVLALEPFANIVRQDKYLHPVQLPNQAPKSVSLYADDTNVICARASDFRRVAMLTRILEDGAGAKINADKTEILCMGQWTEKDLASLPKACVKRNIKVLGVWYGPEAEELNRQQVLDKIDATLDKWRKHQLSLQGKILIINTKVLSAVYHIIRITGMSRTLEKELQKRINGFIWHPKSMAMIAYATLQNSFEMGGIEAPNLRNINGAILVERVAKTAKERRPWSGQLYFRLGPVIRGAIQEAGSKRYINTSKQTEVSKVISATFRRLQGQVKDWSKEDFTSLRKRLHTNVDFKRRVDRNFDDTWRQIRALTRNRKARDVCYLVAHMSLPVRAVLSHRHVGVETVKCCFCGEKDETIRHIFLECRMVQDLKMLMENKLQTRTLGEEEILFHEGRLKMKKKANETVAAYLHAIWRTKGKLFHGSIRTVTEIKETMKSLWMDEN